MAAKESGNGTVLKVASLLISVIVLTGATVVGTMKLMGETSDKADTHADTVVAEKIVIHDGAARAHEQLLAPMRESIRDNSCAMDTLRAVRKDLATKWAADREIRYKDSIYRDEQFRTLLNAIKEKDNENP